MEKLRRSIIERAEWKSRCFLGAARIISLLMLIVSNYKLSGYILINKGDAYCAPSKYSLARGGLIAQLHILCGGGG